MLESDIERAALRKAKKLGWWGIKLVPSIVAGLPDRMFLGHGKIVFIELKTAKGKVTPIQTAIHKRFDKCGIPVHICRSPDEVLEVLNAAE